MRNIYVDGKLVGRIIGQSVEDEPEHKQPYFKGWTYTLLKDWSKPVIIEPRRN